MANHLRSVPLSKEMDTFQAEISGYQRFVAGRDAQGSAIVSNAEANRGSMLCTAANASDNRLFAKRQANSIYKRRARSAPGRRLNASHQRPSTALVTGEAGYPPPGRWPLPGLP